MLHKDNSNARAKYTNVMCGKWIGMIMRILEKQEKLKQIVEKFDLMNTKDYLESVSFIFNADLS